MAGESPAFHLEERRASHNHSGPKPSSDGSELATATIPSRRRMPTNFSNAEAPDDIGRKADSPVTGGGRGLQNSGRNLGEKYQLAPGRKPPRSSYSDESPRALINSGAATQAHSRQRGRNERRSNLDWVRTTSVKSRDEEGGGSVSPGLGTNDAWSKMVRPFSWSCFGRRARMVPSKLNGSPFARRRRRFKRASKGIEVASSSCTPARSYRSGEDNRHRIPPEWSPARVSSHRG